MQKKGSIGSKKPGPVLPQRTSYPSVHLFWTHFHCPLYSPIPPSVLREISLYFPPPPLLFYVSSKLVRRYDFIQSVWGRGKLLKDEIRTESPAYCPLDAWRVLICGGLSEI